MSEEQTPQTEPKEVSLSDVMSALKELTSSMKTLAENVSKLEKEWDRWRRAGRY